MCPACAPRTGPTDRGTDLIGDELVDLGVAEGGDPDLVPAQARVLRNRQLDVVQDEPEQEHACPLHPRQRQRVNHGIAIQLHGRSATALIWPSHTGVKRVSPGTRSKSASRLATLLRPCARMTATIRASPVSNS